MYICICAAVNETTVRAAIESGTTNWKSLCRELKLVQQCGKCGACARSHFEQILAEKNKQP